MVKVRLKSPSELKKIEEFLADAATDKALEAKATYTDQIQQNMMSFQLIRMCESVTETLSKNVLVSGREPRADDDDDEEDLQENEEDLRVKEEKRLKELTCDPELDELENEVAELTEKVGEQRLTGPARVLQNLENRLKDERDGNRGEEEQQQQRRERGRKRGRGKQQEHFSRGEHLGRRAERDEEEAGKVFGRHAGGEGEVAESVGEVGEVDERD